MFTRLHDTNKATIFTVLVLLMALVAALVIRVFGITSGFIAAALYMFTPAEAALIMLLIVTREGFSREGWKTLGLHRLGLNVWWMAFLAALLVSLLATAIVWATRSLRSWCPKTVSADASSASSYRLSCSRSRWSWERRSDGEAICFPSS
jgi:uncharacterized protein